MFTKEMLIQKIRGVLPEIFQKPAKPTTESRVNWTTYDQEFMMDTEKSIFPGQYILTQQDLTDDVLEWARTQFPGSYMEQVDTLHKLIEGWRKAHPEQAQTEPYAWKQLLTSDEWKPYTIVTNGNRA